ISSVNIRIAREIIGAAESLYGKVGKGILIAGGPGSGKTTVLRDIVRQLSDSGQRISLVDTRGEIASASGGRATLDVGINTDVISGGDKAKGVEIALRTLFPQYIAFDEIGSTRELELVSESFFSGTGIITTAHASNIEELRTRRVTKRLLELGAVENIALLPSKIGGRIELIGIKRRSHA
ncbi:MAG: Flp pilus assembly complex ATPase component TadA, partial [Clostridia bacterium]|nr:Flp pilus assembly complex ATPase component TadA [Clostridia bacterium]